MRGQAGGLRAYWRPDQAMGRNIAVALVETRITVRVGFIHRFEVAERAVRASWIVITLT
jgi:hypothetical protein